MQITCQQQDYDTPADFERFCRPYNIDFGHWTVENLSPQLVLEASQNKDAQSAILEAFQDQLTAVKTRHGYLTEDIVCLSSQTPNLSELLAKFDQEHHHTDDEVRVVLSGAGIFGIVPADAPPFEILVEVGDYISIPAYTRHWFTLTQEQAITVIRIFKTAAGWSAIYAPLTTA